MPTPKIRLAAALALTLLTLAPVAAPAQTPQVIVVHTKVVTKKHTTTSRHTHRKPKKKVVKVVPRKIVKPVARKTPIKARPRVHVTAPISVRLIAPTRVVMPAVRGPQMGTRNMPYAVGGAQLTLQGGEITTDQLPNLFGKIPPDAGTQYVLFTIAVKNTGTAPLDWTFDRFNPQLHTTNSGDKILRGTQLLTDKNDKWDAQPIAPGDEKTIRFDFQVPLGTTLKTLTLSNGEAAYSFDVSDIH